MSLKKKIHSDMRPLKDIPSEPFDPSKSYPLRQELHPEASGEDGEETDDSTGYSSSTSTGASLVEGWCGSQENIFRRPLRTMVQC